MRILLFISHFFIFSSISNAENISPKSVEGAVTVTVETAKQLFDQGALFVDVRRDNDWDNARIPDALHLELEKGFNKEALSVEAGVNDPIVFYCNGEKCMRSSSATALAIQWGFKKVYYFRLGFPAWKQADFPVE